MWATPSRAKVFWIISLQMSNVVTVSRAFSWSANSWPQGIIITLQRNNWWLCFQKVKKTEYICPFEHWTTETVQCSLDIWYTINIILLYVHIYSKMFCLIISNKFLEVNGVSYVHQGSLFDHRLCNIMKYYCNF